MLLDRPTEGLLNVLSITELTYEMQTIEMDSFQFDYKQSLEAAR